MTIPVTNMVVTNVLVVGTNGAITGFRVDQNGNITKINNVAYGFPSTQGVAGSTLINDGSGNLTWFKGTIPVKYPVRAATAISLPSSNYANGTAGVGATITGSVNGALIAVDGVTLIVNERLLVKNETALRNGIYALTQVGTVGTPFILTRVTDFDSSAEIISGSIVSVEEGTENFDTLWMLSTNNPIVIGTDAITFKKISMDPFADLLDGEPTIPGTTYANTYTGNNITNETWKRTSNSTNIKTIDYTYSGNKVSTEVAKIYSANGVTVIAQTTRTYTFTGSKVTGVAMTRDV